MGWRDAALTPQATGLHGPLFSWLMEGDMATMGAHGLTRLCIEQAHYRDP